MATEFGAKGSPDQELVIPIGFEGSTKTVNLAWKNLKQFKDSANLRRQRAESTVNGSM